MENDAALRSCLLALAAVMAVVGLWTLSLKKVFATYVYGILGIAGLLLPDWEFFDRDFSQWFTPMTAPRGSAGNRLPRAGSYKSVSASLDSERRDRVVGDLLNSSSAHTIVAAVRGNEGRYAVGYCKEFTWTSQSKVAAGLTGEGRWGATSSRLAADVTVEVEAISVEVAGAMRRRADKVAGEQWCFDRDRGM